jgi:hypothetical protein
MTTHVTVPKRLLPILAVALLLASGLTARAGAGFFRSSSVLAYDTDTWNPWAPTGYNRLVVEGDGDTDLDCYVYDRFGRLIGVDDDGTDVCVIGFENAGSGRVRIQIRNLGGVYNRYRLSLD